MINDRRVVEAALLPQLLARPTQVLINHQIDIAELKIVHHDLNVAMTTAMVGIEGERRHRLMRRVDREAITTLKVLEDRPVMMAFLSVLYLAQSLIHSDRFRLADNSAMDRATTRLLALLEQHGDLWDGMEKSARKMAARLEIGLLARGLYHQTLTATPSCEDRYA